MNVKVKHIECDMSDKDIELSNEFIKYLQKYFPLKNDVSIVFTGERIGEMSTGSRNSKSVIKVFTKKRINRDILRTLAHEWIHEWQMTTKGKKPTGDIGGPIEDEASAKAGSILKMFEKDHPIKEPLMYESIQNKINLLNEQILITEKINIQEEFINEMKQIGIEKLPYSYSAIKQFVDPETMDIHYNKHYKTYVKKLNDALKNTKRKYDDLEEIIRSISLYDTKVRNNAGGAFNHALFWKMLSPTKQLPKKEILNKINQDFGNIKKMKDEFNQVALDRFGSGWVWLVLTKSNKLKIMSTPNQDNPLMNIIKGGGYPILGLDLWEHAYYLRYRNKRDQYIKKFWNSVNWEFVNDLFVSKTKKKLNETYLRTLLKEDTDQELDLKNRMKRELQKIRLIPLDSEAATDAINNIITSSIERGYLNYDRTLIGLMSLDLNNVSERSRYRFNNYYIRWVKSKTRGYDFEALIAGLLGGEMAAALNSPYDVVSRFGDKVSCKVVRNKSEKISLKNVRRSVELFIKNYNGSEENKAILMDLTKYPNFVDLVLRHENQDIRNVGEDMLGDLLSEITGMLVGVPDPNSYQIELIYFNKDALINAAKIPDMLRTGKQSGAQTITFSSKILKLDNPNIIKGRIQFPNISLQEYSDFLIGDENTQEILNLFDMFGKKYGVDNLGSNIPQDIIRDLSKNQRFKLDLKRLLK
jgi:Fe-Mn family superoxide dismutase